MRAIQHIQIGRTDINFSVYFQYIVIKSPIDDGVGPLFE